MEKNYIILSLFTFLIILLLIVWMWVAYLDVEYHELLFLEDLNDATIDSSSEWNEIWRYRTDYRELGPTFRGYFRIILNTIGSGESIKIRVVDSNSVAVSDEYTFTQDGVYKIKIKSTKNTTYFSLQTITSVSTIVLERLEIMLY